MISFVSQIHRDMIDFGYQTILCITSVILTALEENRIEWTDSDDINAMRKQYILNSVSVNSQRSAVVQPVKRKPNSSATPCSSYNLGKCTLSNDHMSNGVVVAHICAFCFSSGSRNYHPEKACRKKNAVLVSH